MKKRKEKKKSELNAQSFTCIYFVSIKFVIGLSSLKKKKQYMGVFEVKMKNSKKKKKELKSGE